MIIPLYLPPCMNASNILMKMEKCIVYLLMESHSKAKKFISLMLRCMRSEVNGKNLERIKEEICRISIDRHTSVKKEDIYRGKKKLVVRFANPREALVIKVKSDDKKEKPLTVTTRSSQSKSTSTRSSQMLSLMVTPMVQEDFFENQTMILEYCVQANPRLDR